MERKEDSSAEVADISLKNIQNIFICVGSQKGKKAGMMFEIKTAESSGSRKTTYDFKKMPLKGRQILCKELLSIS